MAKVVRKTVSPHGNGKEFKLDRHDYQTKHGQTQELALVFNQTDGVTVEWLDMNTNDLPANDINNKPCIWVNYFNVKKNGQHLKNTDGVTYTVFLPDTYFNQPGYYFVYFDGTAVRTDKTPSRTGSQPARPGMVQVDLNIGDPGTGWGGGGTGLK